MRSGLLSGQNFAPSCSIPASHKVIAVVISFTKISSACFRTLCKCSYTYILCDWLSSFCMSLRYIFLLPISVHSFFIAEYYFVGYITVHQFRNILIIFSLGLLQITAKNVIVQVFLRTCNFILDKFLEVDLLGHRVTLCLAL